MVSKKKRHYAYAFTITAGTSGTTDLFSVKQGEAWIFEKFYVQSQALNPNVKFAIVKNERQILPEPGTLFSLHYIPTGYEVHEELFPGDTLKLKYESTDSSDQALQIVLVLVSKEE